jgi:hypothetical protein
MKNLIFAFVLIFAAFFNACQENSITDPITNETSEKDINYYINLANHTIILDAWLADPSQNPGSPLQITGSINYGVSSSVGNQISASNAYNTIIKMKIDALLRHCNPTVDGNISSSTPGYSIRKETVDYIMLDPLGRREYKLVKDYEINGCTHRIFLQCTFAVTTNKVMLRDMKLCCVRQSIMCVPVD